jgi:hypothetical protein
MSWSTSSRGATTTAVLAQLEADVAANPHAPKDGRIVSAAGSILSGFPHEAPAGRFYYANSSGHTEPEGSRGTSFCNVACGEGQLPDPPPPAPAPQADSAAAEKQADEPAA